MIESVIEKSGIDTDWILQNAAKNNFLNFSKFIDSSMEVQPFHYTYYRVLDKFAHGGIKRLIITMPPQHGKSSGSSRKLPAYILGINPDKKIAIGSYAATVAQDFNRDCQRIIDSDDYRLLFPSTLLARSNGVNTHSVWLRNSSAFEVVNRIGGLRAVGRGGALTSRTVDVMILDDVYKDYEEGNSPIVRDKAWKWYTSVVRTRLHNDSQELIVFTRWHEDDLIGRIEKKELVVEIKSLDDLNDIPKDAWVKINYEAIKTSNPTNFDPRKVGQALWESRHSINELIAKRSLDRLQFDCLYQGSPDTVEGALYGEFKTYTNIDGTLLGKGNYTDTADEGRDKLCSISYDKVRGIDSDGKMKVYLYIRDIVYSSEPMEVTTKTVPMLFKRCETRYANIESNNGGKAFAMIVRKDSPNTKVEWFSQTKNKESRILTNSSLVTEHILMPIDWAEKWGEFYIHITKYKRDFKANQYHDAPDVLTGMVEKEILLGEKRKIRQRN